VKLKVEVAAWAAPPQSKQPATVAVKAAAVRLVRFLPVITASSSSGPL
jgi:hypothetical protein